MEGLVPQIVRQSYLVTHKYSLLAHLWDLLLISLVKVDGNVFFGQMQPCTPNQGVDVRRVRRCPAFGQTVEDTVVVGKARHEIALQLLLESHENEDGAQELLSLYLIVASEQELVVQVIADSCPCPHISAITHPYHCTQPSTFS